MARKSRYDQLVARIDRAFKPEPIGDPPPRKGTKILTAAVYNRNWTKSFEEEIINIRPSSYWKGEWHGTVVDSLGRKGTVEVWYNPTRQCWQYA